MKSDLRSAYSVIIAVLHRRPIAISHFMAHWFRRPPVPSVTGKPLKLSFVTSLSTTSTAITSRQNVPYTITCDPDVRDDAQEMTLSWTAARPATITRLLGQTSPGWGLSCNKMASRSRSGTPLKINPSTPPTLQAVPVKASDASLSEGTFSARATLQVDYQ
ncbi:fimbrial protein [Escherichia coli]|nr:fimbrial protein [Escherichia coli]